MIDVVCFAQDFGLDVQRLREYLSRLKRQGRAVRLASGLYCLTREAGVEEIHPVQIALMIDPDVTISMESALEARGISIGRYPLELTCVTRGRTRRLATPFGAVRIRHMSPALWWGYEEASIPSLGSVTVATVEKALLDILHYEPYDRHFKHLTEELRIEGYRHMDVDALRAASQRVGSWPIMRTVAQIEGLRRMELDAAFSAGTGPEPWRVMGNGEILEAHGGRATVDRE